MHPHDSSVILCPTEDWTNIKNLIFEYKVLMVLIYILESVEEDEEEVEEEKEKEKDGEKVKYYIFAPWN